MLSIWGQVICMSSEHCGGVESIVLMGFRESELKNGLGSIRTVWLKKQGLVKTEGEGMELRLPAVPPRCLYCLHKGCPFYWFGTGFPILVG